MGLQIIWRFTEFFIFIVLAICKTITCKNGYHLPIITNYFKCPDSYCIPVRHRCDSVLDCPYGEDEKTCSQFTCKGHFWCPRDEKCLSFIDICDGTVHCLLTGEDEFQCDIKPCPTLCFCAGNSIHCVNKGFKDIPQLRRNVDFLILPQNSISFMNKLRQYPLLLHIDLSFNNIQKIETDDRTEPIFSKSYRLISLNLTSNSLKSLGENQFQNLTNLQFIGIGNNPIMLISRLSFSGLSNIPTLKITRSTLKALCNFCLTPLAKVHAIIIKHSKINTIQKEAFSKLIHLKHIILQNNEILSFDVRFLNSLFNGMLVETDSTGICCFKSSKINCKEIGSTVEFCIGIKLLYLWYLYIPLTLIFNVPVIIIRLHKSYKDVISTIIQHSSLVEVIQVLNLTLRIHLNSRLHQLTFSESYFVSKMCMTAAFFFLWSYFLHVILSSSFCVGYFYVTSYLNTSMSLSHHKKSCFLVFIYIVCAAVSYVVLNISKLIPNLCLPLNSSGRIYPIIIVITSTIAITLASNVLLIIAIRRSDAKRKNAARDKTREEKLLKVRNIAEILTCSICYIPSGIIMLYLSAKMKIQPGLIIALDTLLLQKSIVDSIILTLATKSFRRNVMQTCYYKGSRNLETFPKRMSHISLKTLPG